MDERELSSASDGGLDEAVELLVSLDCQQQVSWSDSLDTVVLRNVACQLEDFGSDVFQDGGTADG